MNRDFSSWLVPFEDAAERINFLKVQMWLFATVFPLLTLVEIIARIRGTFGSGFMAVLFLANVPLVYLLGRLMFWFMGASAQGLANVVFAGGNLTPEPAHSAFESLTARGFYREAADAFRDHLTTHPLDHSARFKLADLCRRHLADPVEAERLYFEVRKGKPTPQQELQSANALIELYRETGRRDRQMVELARFADRWKGTRMGMDALRALHDLKEDVQSE